MRLAVVTALLLVTLVSAQNVIEVGAPEGTSGGDDQFVPPTMNATSGTVIHSSSCKTGNHSVIQSSFANPCTLISGGFDSGFVSIPEAGASETPEWNLTIQDASKPIWFFCKQLKAQHCKRGMVGAINPPDSGSNTFAAFQASAKAFTGNIGQDQGGLVGQGASAAGYPTPIPSGVTTYLGPTPTTTSSATTPASSAGASATAPPKNSALTLHANSVIALLATLLGTVLA